MAEITVSIPGAFVHDAGDGMWDQAEKDPAFESLIKKIEATEPSKKGRGFAFIVSLNEQELSALRSEANYKNEYWNTDSYGIKGSGETIPSYAAAAKRLAQRLNEI